MSKVVYRKSGLPPYIREAYRTSLADNGYNWDSVVQMTDKELIYNYAWITGPFHRKSKPVQCVHAYSGSRKYLDSMYPDLHASFMDMTDEEIADIFGDCFYPAM